MSIERTYYCEGPHKGGARHVGTWTPPPYLPIGWIETREVCDGETTARHFCSWDCVLKFAAKVPLGEVIPFDGFDGGPAS